jgi:hypothetical protein
LLATRAPSTTPPQSGQRLGPLLTLLLGLDDDSDVAGSASPVSNPSLAGEVEMLGVCWLPLSADVAPALPSVPLSIMRRVESLVGERVNESEVLDSVVLLVSVDVVDVESLGDWSVLLLPDPIVDVSESPSELGTVVSLGGRIAEAAGVL